MEVQDKNKFFSQDNLLSCLKTLFSSSEGDLAGFQSHRRTGRTWAMIRAMIEISIEGEHSVFLLDHHSAITGRKDDQIYYKRTLEEVLSFYRDNGCPLRVNKRSDGSWTFQVRDIYTHKLAYERLRIEYLNINEGPKIKNKLNMKLLIV